MNRPLVHAAPPAERSRRRRRLGTAATACALLFALPSFSSSSAAFAAADERAEAAAARALAYMGGEEGWAQVRYLKFTFAGRRTHLWDRQTGRHRVEGQTQEGTPYVVVHDLDTREGKAFLGGQPAPADKAAELLENAYGAWINDTYWLLAPMKLRDPGVKLAWEGEEPLDGAVHDRLALSFEKVGLTPGDRYWVWIDRATGRMDRWGYVLEDQPVDADPTLWRWDEWVEVGPVRLAGRRVREGGDRTLTLTPIELPAAVPDALFEGP